MQSRDAPRFPMRRLSPNARKSPDSYRYRTYGWGQGMPAKNPNLDREIVVAIDEQMARKGFTKTEGDP